MKKVRITANIDTQINQVVEMSEGDLANYKEIVAQADELTTKELDKLIMPIADKYGIYDHVIDFEDTNEVIFTEVNG